jgi:hypothetical protein
MMATPSTKFKDEDYACLSAEKQVYEQPQNPTSPPTSPPQQRQPVKPPSPPPALAHPTHIRLHQLKRLPRPYHRGSSHPLLSHRG